MRNVFQEPVVLSNSRRMEQAVLRNLQLLVKLNAVTFVVFLAMSKPHLIDEAFIALTDFHEAKYRFIEAYLELA